LSLSFLKIDIFVISLYPQAGKNATGKRTAPLPAALSFYVGIVPDI
jgi:hypothetical protein